MSAVCLCSPMEIKGRFQLYVIVELPDGMNGPLSLQRTRCPVGWITQKLGRLPSHS